MALVVVVANAARCEVSFVAFGRSGQVSEARLESTFLAGDAACLTLDRAVIQLRCSEIVSLGCGRLFCVVVWFPQWNMGFGRVLFPQSHRIAHHPKNARAPKSGPLMAIMALLLPGGTSQGLGGGFRRGQRVLRARLAVRYFPRRFGASCPDR